MNKRQPSHFDIVAVMILIFALGHPLREFLPSPGAFHLSSVKPSLHAPRVVHPVWTVVHYKRPLGIR